VSGQHGRGASDDQDHEVATVEAEATTTATVIAGLTWRLRRQENIKHPKILNELSKLIELLDVRLGQSEEGTGRHRLSANLPLSEQIGDAEGFDLRPDPLAATTPEEYIDALWQYKAWSGDPSWRAMAKRAGQAVVYSTMYAAMNNKALPKLDVVKAIITGCGGGEDDLSAFVTAWRRISMGGRTRRPSVDARFLSAPSRSSSLLQPLAIEANAGPRGSSTKVRGDGRHPVMIRALGRVRCA
jgi:hypothetical protein